MRLFFIFTVAFIFGAPAMAQDYKTLLDIPSGSTLVNLSATESVEVEQDMLIANLRFEAENIDPRAVQSEVNSMMKKALDLAVSVSSVKASTQQYYVHEYDRSRGQGARRDIVWRAQQGLMLKGKKADDLLKLAGDLQDIGLKMNGLNYMVSPELLEETRNGLLEDALEKLRVKADRTAKALGKTKTEFLQINVDTGGYYQPPMMRTMAMADGAMEKGMAAPVAAPGESQITLTVSTQALLSQ